MEFTFMFRELHLVCLLSTVLYTRCEGGCIQPSCTRRNFSTACGLCQEENGEILSLKHLVVDPKENTTNQLLNALTHLTIIWIEKGEQMCSSHENECPAYIYMPQRDTLSLHNKHCADEYHFFCYHESNDSNCAKCLITERITTTTALDTNSQESDPSTDDSPAFKMWLLPVIIVVSVCVVVVVIVVIVFLCKRQRKPGKYAVREASAIYHRQHPAVETGKGEDSQDVTSGDGDTMQLTPGHDRCNKGEGDTKEFEYSSAVDGNYDKLGRESAHYYTDLKPLSVL